MYRKDLLEFDDILGFLKFIKIKIKKIEGCLIFNIVSIFMLVFLYFLNIYIRNYKCEYEEWLR